VAITNEARQGCSARQHSGADFTRGADLARGARKWILENILGTPVPPPPPTCRHQENQEGNGRAPCASRWLSTAQCRVRELPQDYGPIGWRWEFRCGGAWRSEDAGAPIDATGNSLTHEGGWSGDAAKGAVESSEVLLER